MSESISQQYVMDKNRIDEALQSINEAELRGAITHDEAVAMTNLVNASKDQDIFDYLVNLESVNPNAAKLYHEVNTKIGNMQFAVQHPDLHQLYQDENSGNADEIIRATKKSRAISSLNL